MNTNIHRARNSGGTGKLNPSAGTAGGKYPDVAEHRGKQLTAKKGRRVKEPPQTKPGLGYEGAELGYEGGARKP